MAVFSRRHHPAIPRLRSRSTDQTAALKTERHPRSGHSLKVATSILANIRRIPQRRTRRNAIVDDGSQLTLQKLPNDVMLMVMKELDVPSRISLSLTNKLFAERVQMVSTVLNDRASIVKFHARCPSGACLYANHISDRRILLLQLHKWMPRGYRLCWKCQRYSKIKGTKWHCTTRVNFAGLGRLNIHAINQLGLWKVFCHDKCLPSGRELSKWVWETKGASGGFARFTGSPERPSGGELYDAGF
ncbi:uncharacterized protein Z518_05079 [Rhinocladiella mackenziei CBS 650.93]|uniref:F-box domain-containing protein n=1 Tax=Rhinocladiella mackenziei CBS 650.93 TaxID=1442369 RepID=A0A0D2FXT5_9EURO|nr:uncharacterized protein Z518_05079 [Rhinocladiella mackenziei CBS 650.93]KIX07102.1 hypothetical protein Z518_05079 [Rhinocladiella mackenziei CBS 650.93]